MAVEHDEDLLRKILDLPRRGAEPLQRLEQVFELPIVGLEAAAFRG